MLGQVVEDHGELVIGQDLHMVLGRGHIFCQNLGNGFGGKTLVLGPLMERVCIHSHTNNQG